MVALSDAERLVGLGLTHSEAKVYLALLKRGASSTGPIVSDAQIANSKVYAVLDKLIHKGLVSFFSKDGVRFFKAASPQMLLEFVAEKKRAIEHQEQVVSNLVPSLAVIQSAKQSVREASVFSGVRGIKTAFTLLVNDLEAGAEVHVMGTHSFGAAFKPLALFFQKLRSKKGIKGKFLMNTNAQEIAELFEKYPPVEIRFLPKDVLTPAIFLVWKDTVIINIPDELTFFVLKSQSAANTFDAYFKLLWKNAARNR